MTHPSESAPQQESRIIVPFPTLTPAIQEIVRGIHARLVEEDIFVPRADEKNVWDNHHVILGSSDSAHPTFHDFPLGGASIIDDSSGRWKELTRVWTHEEHRGNGIASAIIQHWMRQQSGAMIFALTKKPGAYRLLERNNFMGMGTVEGLQKSMLRDYLPDRVKQYPRGRDPWMLVRHLTHTSS